MRGRKRHVLSEILKEPIPLPELFPRQHMLPIIYQEEYLRKNRFIVSLFTDNLSIPPERIRGYKITKTECSHSITVMSTLMWSEWIDIYEKVTIIQVQIFDTSQKELRFIDLDVLFMGYHIDGDHRSEDLMQPTFTYKIMD